MKKVICTALLALLVITCTFGQVNKGPLSKHVHWQIHFEPDKEKLDEGVVVFEVSIDTGYFMYAANQMPGLPVGVDIEMTNSREYSVVGDLMAPKPEISFSHTYHKPIAVYRGKIEFRQKIKLKTKKEFKLSSSVESEDYGQSDEVFLYQAKLDLSIRPPKGIRLIPV